MLAFTSYLLVAVAEQGSAGAGLEIVPDDPLPFRSHVGVGIDLSAMSSLAALEWIENADVPGAPLLVMPVDGDIVAAFNDPETFGAARTAIDSLIGAGGDIPVVLCLRKPVTATEESVLAEAVVTVIVEDYTDSVAYLSTCPGDSSDTWHTSILTALGWDSAEITNERALAPVSIGAAIRVPDAIPASEMTDIYIDRLVGSSYVAITLDRQSLLTEPLRNDIRDALTDRSHVALVLVRPDPDVNPQEFGATARLDLQAPAELSEGYNDVFAPAVTFEGEWTPTRVGPVVYQRTTETGASLSAGFVGTEVWAVGLVSPAAGTIGVWIDAEEPVTSVNPDRIIDLSGEQAVDDAMLLIDNLPAATHQITIVASDGEVAIAGLFVTGRPEGGWHGGLGALGILFSAMAGLAVVISVAVDDLRARIGLDRSDEQDADHPRIFRREL